MKPFPVFLLFISLISRVGFAETSPSSFLSNRKGIEELKKSNPSAAQERFLNALSKNPFEARLHLNLGLTYEALGQMDKARSAYQTALELAQDPESRFAAHFNLGALSQKEKKVDEALSSYQEALKLDPNSIETKTNIELLIQSEQGQGKGEGDQKDQKDPKDNDEKGDQGKDPKEDEKKDDKKKDGDDEKPKEYSKNKPQPKKFKSEQLSQGDVNKILGEIKQQEQKIRAEFNKKETKEQPRDKDW